MHGTTISGEHHTKDRPGTAGQELPGSPAAPPTAAMMTLMLICDDRPDVGRSLAQHVQQPAFVSSPTAVVGVADGYALLEALESTPEAAVLIAVHAGSTAGNQAHTMLLTRHPTAAPIIVGSAADIQLLAAAYIRGAAGLLLWEPNDTVAAAIGGASELA